MTLEAQYKKYLKENSLSTLTFDLWKDYNSHNIKQALVNMMKNDEELGLYDETTKCYCGHTTTCDCGPEEPKQNWYHDGKIIDGKQEKMYSEEEVLDITKQAFVLGKDFGLIGTFNEWFEQFRKK